VGEVYPACPKDPADTFFSLKPQERQCFDRLPDLPPVPAALSRRACRFWFARKDKKDSRPTTTARPASSLDTPPGLVRAVSAGAGIRACVGAGDKH